MLYFLFTSALTAFLIFVTFISIFRIKIFAWYEKRNHAALQHNFKFYQSKPLNHETSTCLFERLIPNNKNGYEFSTFDVETEDGYILKLFNLKHKKNPIQGVVLLQHGLSSSASSWLFKNNQGSSDNNIGNYFLKKNFSVWFGNNRANKWSRWHKNPNLPREKFFDFSFQELAEFDLPTMYKHIMKTEKVERIDYVGYS